MSAFSSEPYPIDLYLPGAVDASRFTVTFTAEDGGSARVGGGEIAYTTGARSCTCADFTLGGQVCLHMRARQNAFRKFARDYGLALKEPPRPLWAEDVRD